MVSSNLVRNRTTLEEDEVRRLSLAATLSSEATRRRSEEADSSDLRLAFQRDRDRILHARAFRRLKHKTQVFVPHVADHPRTRLTHTLEVGQLARTIARALGLNEDLAEAAAMGHDLGHTAFGHTGEATLDEILRGTNREAPLPRPVADEVGRFKHNYQSLRVVDLFERRYGVPGINLTDQVREAILKHTSWQVGFPFPLPDRDGLRLDRPCHLEGQAVSVADEIAQQTHDLEDGLRATSVTLEEVEELAAARRIAEEGGESYAAERSWDRQNTLVRGLIRLFVTDVVAHSAGRIDRYCERYGIVDHDGWRLHADEISQTTVWFSSEVERLFSELKSFIYQRIINQASVSRQDWRARRVMAALFSAYWREPAILPDYLLRRAAEELELPYLRDLPLSRVAATVADRYHANSGFARLIIDHLAGMSDRFALEEYRALQLPSPDQVLRGGSS
jgi:dGTPase